MLQMTATMARKTALKRFIRFAGIISLDAGAVALSFFLAFDLRLQGALPAALKEALPVRSEEHTSELQSLMRISYAVFCLKKKTTTQHKVNNYYSTICNPIVEISYN